MMCCILCIFSVLIGLSLTGMEMKHIFYTKILLGAPPVIIVLSCLWSWMFFGGLGRCVQCAETGAGWYWRTLCPWVFMPGPIRRDVVLMFVLSPMDTLLPEGGVRHEGRRRRRGVRVDEGTIDFLPMRHRQHRGSEASWWIRWVSLLHSGKEASKVKGRREEVVRSGKFLLLASWLSKVLLCQSHHKITCMWLGVFYIKLCCTRRLCRHVQL